MLQRLRTPLIALVVVFGLAILTAFVWFTSRTKQLPPLPSPNGYDDFIKASRAVSANVGYYREMDHDSLRGLVSTNAESLRLFRMGLTRQCVMPMDLMPINNLSYLADMKKLAQLLAAEGRLREMDNQPADAAHSYADAIRFGNEMSRGGFLITRLVGIACEAIGCGALARVAPKLGREDARLVLSELEKVDTSRVTWAEVRRQENYFMRSQLRHQWNPIVWARGWWQNRQMLGISETKHQTMIAHERLIAGELALSCYQLEHGHPPARLEELATNYLSNVPQDPFSDQPMIYRPQGTHWLLYSVGPDGVDDGGQSVGRGSPMKGDIRFDSPW
jgi:hypothetical protein